MKRAIIALLLVAGLLAMPATGTAAASTEQTSQTDSNTEDWLMCTPTTEGDRPVRCCKGERLVETFLYCVFG